MVNKSRLLRPTGIFFSFLFFFDVVVLLFLDLVKRVQRPQTPKSNSLLRQKGLRNPGILGYFLIDWILKTFFSTFAYVRDAILITAYKIGTR